MPTIRLLGRSLCGSPILSDRTTGWAPLPTASALPIEPTRYPLFWRTPLWRPWRSILALVIGVIAFLLVLAVLPIFGVGLDIATGRYTVEEMLAELGQGRLIATPAIFISNNIGLALLTPVSFVIARLLFKQKGGWLSSVVGRFRWSWFAWCLAVLAPIWLVTGGFELWLTLRSGDVVLAVNDDTWVMLIGVLLTTPLQCAGEEFSDRGLINRAASSFIKHPVAGPLLGALVSSALFMAAHSAQDVWLNGFYFAFGMIACWLTWRTGGLEAAIAMHVVNNLVTLSVAPFMDISGLFDRGESTATPMALVIGLIAPLVGVGVIEVLTRRRKLVVESAPGRNVPEDLPTIDLTVLPPPLNPALSVGSSYLPPASMFWQTPSAQPEEAARPRRALPDPLPASPTMDPP